MNKSTTPLFHARLRARRGSVRGLIATVLVSALVAAPGATAATTPTPLEETVPAAVHAPPLRVMLAGDSITHQHDGDVTWRARLWREFQRQEVQVDFVGPRSQTRRHGYDIGGSFDRDHNALGGTTVALEKDRIRGQVRAHRAQVLVVIMGHNDLARGARPAEVARSMSTYISRARAANPRLKVVLGTVMDAHRSGRDKFAGRNHELNQRYRDLAVQLSTARSPIVVARTARRGWDPTVHTYDGAHLTPLGESRVAAAVARALHAPRVGALPRRPRAALRAASWSPNPRATAQVLSDGRLRVSFESEAARMRASVMVVHVRRASEPQWRRDVATRAGYLESNVRYPNDTYRIWLTPRRGTMTGTPGPVTQLTSGPVSALED